MRSHTCGQVTDALIGQEVTLAGWVNRRRDHGGVIFIDLRDHQGFVQVIIILVSDLENNSRVLLVCIMRF